jgi:hypothetical protein
MSGRLGPDRAVRAGVAAALAVAGLVVAAAQAVAQVPLELTTEVERPMLAPFGPQGDAAGDAIGDPWWDEAEAGRPAAKPEAGAAGEPQAQEPADAQANLEAQLRGRAEMLAESVRQQGLAILRRELSLVRQSCPSLEKQQRALVLEAGRGAIDRAVDEQMQAAGGGRRRVLPKRGGDLETAIRDALKNSVRANATDTELVAYESEHRLREERRKAAVVAALVAEVDREAYLDDAERAALAKGLTASYRERWRRGVTEIQQNVSIVPDENILPGLERCVEKALGKPRKDQWMAARDEARRLAGGAGMQQGQVQIMGNGGVRVRAQLFFGRGQPGVRRLQVGGNGGQMQVEVQETVVDGEQPDAAAAAPAAEEK